MVFARILRKEAVWRFETCDGLHGPQQAHPQPNTSFSFTAGHHLRTRPEGQGLRQARRIVEVPPGGLV